MDQALAALELAGGRRLVVVRGDLTEQRADAIVNAANSRLAHGGGVAGAIVRKGGHEIQVESDAWVRANGEAGHDRPALTGAGRLPCRAVIHAVGPVWQGGGSGEDEALRAAYASALGLAAEHGYATVACPSISTGIFGFPVARAARIAVGAARDYMVAHPGSSLREVRFVLIDAAAAWAFRGAMDEIASAWS